MSEQTKTLEQTKTVELDNKRKALELALTQTRRRMGTQIVHGKKTIAGAAQQDFPAVHSDTQCPACGDILHPGHPAPLLPRHRAIPALSRRT